MAARKPLVIISGTTQQIPDADFLASNGGIGRSTAGALVIGFEANSTSVEVGRVGALTTVKGDLQVDGTETVIGTSTFQANATFNGNVQFGNATTDTVTFTSRFVGDIHFQQGAVTHAIDVDQSVAGGGGNIGITGGAAQAASSGAGGSVGMAGGLGAATNAVTDAGNGGDVVLTGGNGGTGSIAFLSGQGGAVNISGGIAGSAGGGAGNFGGGVTINAGAGPVLGQNGTIEIGTTIARIIQMGNTTDQTSYVFQGSGGAAFNSTIHMTGTNGPASIELRERVGDPTGVGDPDNGFVYTKDVAGLTQLFYQDSAGTVTQLTPATGSTTDIVITDNVANAFQVREGANQYININTTNGAENITLGNTTTNPTFTLHIKDNTTNALQISEGANSYFNVNTTDGAEAITYGNTTTNPTQNFAGTGLTTFAGAVNIHGNTDLGLTSANTVAFTARVTGNVSFTAGSNHTISVATAAAATIGNNLNVLSGAGGAASGVTAGGGGGQVVAQGGAGGDGNGTAIAGIGGRVVLQGGDAGTDGGAGGNNGGNIEINAGTGSGAGTKGTIGVGDTGASSIQIGNAPDATAITVLGASLSVSSTTASIASVTSFTSTSNTKLVGPGALEILERAGDPANVANSGILYTKDVAGLTQLFYEDSAGTVNQLTPTGGSTTDIVIADNVTNAFRVRTATEEYININTTNAAENMSLGNATTNPTFSFLGTGTMTVSGALLANGNVTLGNATADTTTFTGRVGGDVNFVPETNHNLIVAASTTVGVAGGNLNLTGGQGAAGAAATAGGSGGAGRTLGGNGGNGGTTGAGGTGGVATVLAGSGGSAGSTTGAGGNGGDANVASGDGAAGTATAVSGSGGSINITAGVAGTDGGAGGAGGGSIIVTAGASEGVAQSGGDIIVTTGTPNGLASDGGDLQLTSADGTTGDATFAGGTGGSVEIISGRGGFASAAQPAGSGGQINIFGNNGGNGTATQPAGAGASVELAGGGGGTDGGGGGGAGGTVILAPGTATNGSGVANVQIINGSAVEMFERSGDPTAVANSGLLYTKDVATITQLFYRDSAGTVNQLTPTSGSTTDIVIADNTTNAFQVREGANQYININTTNAAENISFGNATTNPTFSFLGTGTTTFTGSVVVNGNTTLGNATTDTITATARITGSVHFQENANHTIDIDPSTGVGTAGGTLNITGGFGSAGAVATPGGNGGAGELVAGNGGAGGTTGAGGIGGAINVTAGNGGAAGSTTGAGGTGGVATVLSGNGAAGTATATAGAGGDLTITAGTAGANGGAGGNLGGVVRINAGAGTGASASGSIQIGATKAASITLGNATDNTPISVVNGTGTVTLGGTGNTQLTGPGAFEILERGADPTNVANSGLLYTKDVSTVTQLFYRDSAGTVTQLTPVGTATSAGTVTVSGLTTTGVTTGLSGYVSADNVMTLTDADAAASSIYFGTNSGTAGTMIVCGTVTATFTTAGGPPVGGQPCFLAPGTEEASAAGKLTMTAPGTTGQTIAQVGIVLDNLSATSAVILIQVKNTIGLS